MPATKPTHTPAAAPAESVAADDAVRALSDAVNGLAAAERTEDVQRIVSSAARRLTAADGATIALRDGEHCVYLDEDAIEPLWKGKRFPLGACISGWAMLNRRDAAIEDVYTDYRVPRDVYESTFVKSVVIVPIRRAEPLGAIGVYWSRPHRATPQELGLTHALADSATVALERVHANGAPPTVGLADLDPLTRLFNRHAWERAVTEALDPRIAPLSVALIAIDGLDHYSELHGHPAADALLRRAAEGWQSVLREQDLLARYADDEFAVLLPECDEVAGRRVAERLCLCVPDDETASIGIASWDGDEVVESVLGRADAALHEARASGPARIVVAA
jgi:diguanylate cyclase (GGDEF)-like protein